MMAVRYVAVKDSEAFDVMAALDVLGIKYDYFGHDEVWSVIKMHGFNGVGAVSYESALEKVGVVE